MSDKKTHYRKVFKSDHLGVADLEDFLESGTPLIFTILHVKQEFNVMVAGRKGNFNIAYFKEKIKPLVLNAGNSKTMKRLANGSAFVEDWVNIPVRLYIDETAKLKGEVVGGVRISQDRPKMQKEELLPGTKSWENAKVAYNRDGDLKKVEARMTISPANKAKLIEEAKNVD